MVRPVTVAERERKRERQIGYGKLAIMAGSTVARSSRGGTSVTLVVLYC